MITTGMNLKRFRYIPGPRVMCWIWQRGNLAAEPRRPSKATTRNVRARNGRIIADFLASDATVVAGNHDRHGDLNARNARNRRYIADLSEERSMRLPWQALGIYRMPCSGRVMPFKRHSQQLRVGSVFERDGPFHFLGHHELPQAFGEVDHAFFLAQAGSPVPA